MGLMRPSRSAATRVPVSGHRSSFASSRGTAAAAAAHDEFVLVMADGTRETWTRAPAD
jgi:hypothetical protein